MTPAWPPIAARIVQLLAAAIVGAVAVVAFTRGPVTPLTATDIGFAQDMSAHPGRGENEQQSSNSGGAGKPAAAHGSGHERDDHGVGPAHTSGTGRAENKP
jgi:hypothetical protein